MLTRPEYRIRELSEGARWILKSLSGMTVLGVAWKHVQWPQSSENIQVVPVRIVGGVVRELGALREWMAKGQQ